MTGGRGRKTSKQAPHTRQYIWLLLAAIGVLVLLGFSSSVYFQGEQSGWVVNCSGEECVASGHFHADLKLTVCGEQIKLPSEGGKLDGHHTHKEPNKVHWHSTVPSDKQTGPESAAVINVRNILEDFKISLPSTCGDLPAQVFARISYKQIPNSLLYPWSDGDTIAVEVK